MRLAWPILVPREGDETHESWRARLLKALAEARAEDARLFEDLSRRMDVRPGGGTPILSRAEMEASDRVEMLERQLAGRPFNAML